jgi:UDP-4-amino-4,6-dideoxy-N-acetyl-beta-L-altrosamine N-acetyltransferase
VRVALRPLAADDAELVVAWRSRPDVDSQLFSQPPTVESHRRWFNDYQNRTDREEFIVLLEGRAVGTVGLSHIDRENRRAEYGILVGETAARGSGVGAAASRLILARAFGPLSLSRVFLHVFPDNAPALRLYERIGFKREGLLRSHVVKNGVARDVVAMGLLAAELSAHP